MENSEPAKKRSPLVFILLGVIVVAAFFGIRTFLHNRHHESTDNAQIESRSVPVIARVAGYLDSIAVDDYGSVRQGQMLIKIDSKEFQIALAQAKADLMNAEADMANAVAAQRNAI